MVGHYINTHQVSEKEIEIISKAIQAKSEVESSKNFNSLCNDSSPCSSNINKTPPNIANEKFIKSQSNETNNRYKINNIQMNKKNLFFDNKTRKLNIDNVKQIDYLQPENLYV